MRKAKCADPHPIVVFNVHSHERLEYFEVTEIMPQFRATSSVQFELSGLTSGALVIGFVREELAGALMITCRRARKVGCRAMHGTCPSARRYLTTFVQSSRCEAKRNRESSSDLDGRYFRIDFADHVSLQIQRKTLEARRYQRPTLRPIQDISMGCRTTRTAAHGNTNDRNPTIARADGSRGYGSCLIRSPFRATRRCFRSHNKAVAGSNWYN